ncbi:MAG: YfiR family protein [Planctomycetota bacterium]
MNSTPKPTHCQFGGSRCSSAGRHPVREPQRRAPAKRRLLAALAGLVVLAALCWQSVSARAQQAQPAGSVPNEYTVKAVFLYSFGRYVEWPENTFRNASDPFVIGIVGEDSFGGSLDEVAAKKTLQDRRIVVKRFASPDQYKQPCHILFVSRSLPQDQQIALIKNTQGTAVLVVGETPGFAENGGPANFFIDGDRVRFEINVTTARQSRLRMDAKLLNLGKPVGSQPTAASN